MVILFIKGRSGLKVWGKINCELVKKNATRSQKESCAAFVGAYKSSLFLLDGLEELAVAVGIDLAFDELAGLGSFEVGAN